MKMAKGFTLIELLVVIAIIGILSSIVLASLNTARAKGADAKVKSQISSIRNASTIYQDNHGDYGPTTTDCAGVGSMFVDDVSGMAALTNPTNYPGGAILSCDSQTGTFAVSAVLPTDNTTSWCVDSTGATTMVAVSPAINAGTHLCD